MKYPVKMLSTSNKLILLRTLCLLGPGADIWSAILCFYCRDQGHEGWEGGRGPGIGLVLTATVVCFYPTLGHPHNAETRESADI